MLDAMLREAPRSDDLDLFPRLAANAAPAAICCFFDFAGMDSVTRMTRPCAMGPLPTGERHWILPLCRST
jgi:hypothetical protein